MCELLSSTAKVYTINASTPSFVPGIFVRCLLRRSSSFHNVSFCRTRFIHHVRLWPHAVLRFETILGEAGSFLQYDNINVRIQGQNECNIGFGQNVDPSLEEKLFSTPYLDDDEGKTEFSSRISLNSFDSSPADHNSSDETEMFTCDVPRTTLFAEELNSSLHPDHLQRHRESIAPEEAFGAIFTWDVVVSNARELELMCWKRVAKEKGMMCPDLDDILRSEQMGAEAAISKVFHWTNDWDEIKGLVAYKNKIHAELELGFPWRANAGLGSFLKSLVRHGVKCVLCASQPLKVIEHVVEELGFDAIFNENEIVSCDGGFVDTEQILLMAAMRCGRPPDRCIVFTDKVAGITAGHEVTSKVVALAGTHPVYEVKTADHVITSFSDLVVYNLRMMFSDCGIDDIILERDPLY